MRVSSVLNYSYNNSSSQLQQNNRLKDRSCVLFCGGVKLNKEINCDVVEIFKSLAQIPSPPLKEKKVANWIMKFCKKNKINAEFDNYENIKINIPATDKTKKPLLLSAHMDVVGDDSPVNLITEGEFIKTDGKRTLGADDKAGIAVALNLAKEIVKGKFKHGGVEMLFTRDEELNFSGIKNVDFKNIKSKYVLVLDEASLGKFDNSGAGYTTGFLSLETRFGGHSGMDIKDKKRINAAKAIADLISKFPQGLCSKGKKNFTSMNIGTIIAGDIQNSAAKISEDKIVSKDYQDYFMKNAVTNVINTKANAALSIRSSNKNQENELRKRLENIVEKFNKKNEGQAKAKLDFEELIPPFEKVEDSTMEKVYKKACESVGLKPTIGTFPAGAETHIIANQKNKDGESFVPNLIGVADIYDMHSASERINFLSLRKGYELIKKMFLIFNK